MITLEKPASTWLFDQGALTVHHLGKTISLGRYATHGFAAKAAAEYFAKHGGRPRFAAIMTFGCDESRWVFTYAPARKKHSVLRFASSAAGVLSKKLVSASRANSSREQIPPQLKRHP
jgi:hypothetical protein